uniref:Uncharacterized protein n=1 Tax=Arion vulgaris TaxID=1028688 RepID=A0A0B7BV85_9EUPU
MKNVSSLVAALYVIAVLDFIGTTVSVKMKMNVFRVENKTVIKSVPTHWVVLSAPVMMVTFTMHQVNFAKIKMSAWTPRAITVSRSALTQREVYLLL